MVSLVVGGSAQTPVAEPPVLLPSEFLNNVLAVGNGMIVFSDTPGYNSMVAQRRSWLILGRAGDMKSAISRSGARIKAILPSRRRNPKNCEAGDLARRNNLPVTA